MNIIKKIKKIIIKNKNKKKIKKTCQNKKKDNNLSQ